MKKATALFALSLMMINAPALAEKAPVVDTQAQAGVTTMTDVLPMAAPDVAAEELLNIQKEAAVEAESQVETEALVKDAGADVKTDAKVQAEADASKLLLPLEAESVSVKPVPVAEPVEIE